MLKNALFGGVNAAVLTAMNADLSLDLDRMAAHCRWLLANGCNGLAVLEHNRGELLGVRGSPCWGLIAAVFRHRKCCRAPALTALTDTVLLTKSAEALGCRGALMPPPFYYEPIRRWIAGLLQ